MDLVWRLEISVSELVYAGSVWITALHSKGKSLEIIRKLNI